MTPSNLRTHYLILVGLLIPLFVAWALVGYLYKSGYFLIPLFFIGLEAWPLSVIIKTLNSPFPPSPPTYTIIFEYIYVGLSGTFFVVIFGWGFATMFGMNAPRGLFLFVVGLIHLPTIIYRLILVLNLRKMPQNNGYFGSVVK